MRSPLLQGYVHFFSGPEDRPVGEAAEGRRERGPTNLLNLRLRLLLQRLYSHLEVNKNTILQLVISQTLASQ